MMNYFDLSTGMAGTKKAFSDGSNAGKTRLVLANKVIDPVDNSVEDKPATYEFMKSSSAKKSSTKPMKMLIAQEMSKELDSKRKSPNVVARLMGLEDSLPTDSHIFSTRNNWQDASSDLIQAETRLHSYHSYCSGSKNCRDVNEVRKRSSRSNSVNDQVLPKTQHNDNQNEKRMAFVREKFMEAKRLATDEKRLESKEFHDALEVLSSNRDLFLKFLEEPSSVFSSHLEELQSIPSPPHTKRITVLKPSKKSEMKSNVKQHQCSTPSELQDTLWCSSFSHRQMTEKLSQPTRIVVLKPSPKKHLDQKSPSTPAPPSLESPERVACYGFLNTQESMGSREADKDIKLQMRENLSRHRRDESLLSSVFSNGYVGDDSSFNRSDNYVEREDCNNTDSEITSSWDYMSNRYGSPCSHSSLSRDSFSPESSVIREAKKRLSERWALVTSNGLYQDKLQGRRSSSTLGEMLSINVLKNEDRNVMALGASGVNSNGSEEDFEVTATCLPIGRIKAENGAEGSNSNLPRSKSVPTSSLSYSNIALNTAGSDFLTEKSVLTKGLSKSRSGKTSFKGRVSSLLFLKNKKGVREKSISSPISNGVDTFPIGSADSLDLEHDSCFQTIQILVPEVSRTGGFETESGLTSSPFSPKVNSDESKTSTEVSLCHEDPEPSGESQETISIPEKLIENQDHPSPTSILDAPFKDDATENTPNSSKFLTSDNPQALSRSPPIESISRTLSWDVSCSKALSTASFKLQKGADDSEDLILVENLLTASGLCKNSVSTIFNGWHSPDIPLDPKLLDKLLNVNDAVAKDRERRSTQKLIFDCVNIVLREIAWSAEQGAYLSVPDDENLLAGEVWPVVKKKLGEAENGGLVVDVLLGREVTGSGWSELMQTEVTAISKEIGVQVLDDLFGEALMEMNDS